MAHAVQAEGSLCEATLNGDLEEICKKVKKVEESS